MAQQNMAEKVWLWLHGRILGVAGDLQAASQCLVLNGVPVASTRATIMKAAVGHNGAGAVTLAGTVVGDNVISVTNLTTPGDVTSSFESTITVAGQIQQSAATDLSAAVLLYKVQPQS